MSIQMTNYMEVCVENAIDEILKNYEGDDDICTCPRCRADIMAIALNNLPTKYVVTPKGEKFAKLISLQTQFDVDIVAEITKAIEIVKNNKRH